MTAMIEQKPRQGVELFTWRDAFAFLTVATLLWGMLGLSVYLWWTA